MPRPKILGKKSYIRIEDSDEEIDEEDAGTQGAYVAETGTTSASEAEMRSRNRAFEQFKKDAKKDMRNKKMGKEKGKGEKEDPKEVKKKKDGKGKQDGKGKKENRRKSVKREQGKL